MFSVSDMGFRLGGAVFIYPHFTIEFVMNYLSCFIFVREVRTPAEY